MNLSDRNRRIARVATVIVVVAAAVTWLHPWPRTGPDRVQRLISWPDCVSITRDPPGSRGALGAWTTARERTRIDCHNAGPTVGYARFRSVRDRDAALRRTPPDARSCLAGREVVLDGLDSGFPHLCDELGGRLLRRR